MAPKTERARATLQRSGGFGGIVLGSTVDTDDLDQAERDIYLNLLDGLDLSELSQIEDRSGPQQSDRFQYDLTVEVHGQRFTMRYGEGDVPAQLQPLTKLLVERARQGR